MQNPAAPTETLSLERLLKLHSLTKDIAKHCQKQLRAHLDTLAPLFRPRRILGDFVEGPGREPMVGADRNFAELGELYKSLAQKTFDLRPELNAPIESISTQLQLSEWEYDYDTEVDKTWSTIHVTSPLTWVLSYSSQYSVSSLRQVLAGRQPREEAAVRAFVLRACLLATLFQKLPGLSQLLSALRYRVEIRRSRDFGELPLVTLSPPLSTLRPPDELVILASGLAGGSNFTEVIDPTAVRDVADPLRDDFLRILKDHGETV
jgi:hypothetical protein